MNFDWLISSAHAQAAPAASAAATSQNPIMSFLPLIIIFVIFYFLMIRPQKKQAENEQKMIETLKKGDEIYTKSGLIGVVVGTTEKVFTIDLGKGNEVKVFKSQIAGLYKDTLATDKK